MLSSAILLPAWWLPPSARYGLRSTACTRSRVRRMSIADRARLDTRLDAVVDGVLDQRLQHERRHQRVRAACCSMCQSTFSRSPSRSCSSSRYCRHSSTSRAIGVSSRLSRHQHAEELGQVLERGLGALRVLADQRQHRIDAVEQEVRADARLQRLQPRLRRAPATARARAGGSRRAAAPSTSSTSSAERAQRRGLAHRQRRVQPDAANAVSASSSDDHRRDAQAVRQAPQQVVQRDAARAGSAIRSGCTTRGHVERAPSTAARASAPSAIAAASAMTFTMSRTRRRMPRLRKLGRALRVGVLIYTCHREFPHSTSDCTRRASGASRRPMNTAGSDSTGRLMSSNDKAAPHAAALVGPLRRAGHRSRQALHRVGRLRPASCADSTSRARSRTRACCTRAGIIAQDDLAAIEKGLAQIRDEIARGAFAWSIELEDVHLNIERRLTELVGDAGKRLHTARSRNDQVATDVRLYLRAAIDDMPALLARCRRALLDVAEKHAETVMPGFTHLQVAQPVSFAHHLLAYYEMLARDAQRFADCRKRVNRLPLGAAALAGTSFPIDREKVAQGARLRRRLRELARRRLRSRLRDRVLRLRGAPHDPPLALLRRAHPLDEPALRLHRSRPTASAPARRSCRRRRTPTSPLQRTCSGP